MRLAQKTRATLLTNQVQNWNQSRLGRDWLIELSANKQSDNYLASELVEDMNFLNQSQSRIL